MPKKRQPDAIGEISDAAITITPTLREELKAVVAGLGSNATYNEAISLFIGIIKHGSESAYDMGRRLRDYRRPDEGGWQAQHAPRPDAPNGGGL